jgi:plasmid stabilization system protein ParE
MNSYQFTPQAVDDLFGIWSFIAKDNPSAADRVEDAIFRACDFLADSPLAGRIRLIPFAFGWCSHILTT